jgi:methylmalonyl-CoA/ethylmalonyl-CoA epimerase
MVQVNRQVEHHLGNNILGKFKSIEGFICSLGRAGGRPFTRACSSTANTGYFYRKPDQMQKVEHIGIAVKNLQESIALFEKLLGSACYKTEVVETENLTTAFFQTGETKIELLQGHDQDNVISKFIQNKGEGIHHIAFAVTDIDAEMQRLKANGFVLLQDKPKPGADNKLVCFLHPKNTNSVLIELCMEKK